MILLRKSQPLREANLVLVSDPQRAMALSTRQQPVPSAGDKPKVSEILETLLGMFKDGNAGRETSPGTPEKLSVRKWLGRSLCWL